MPCGPILRSKLKHNEVELGAIDAAFGSHFVRGE